MSGPTPPVRSALAPARPLARTRPLAWLLDRLVSLYQRTFSPLLPPACRFAPSCSHYAREALAHHHLPRALTLITWRLLRCQPLCAGGVDPVPPGPHTPTRSRVLDRDASSPPTALGPTPRGRGPEPPRTTTEKTCRCSS